LPDRPQFRLFEYENFVTNLRNLRKSIKALDEHSASDFRALTHDRVIHPVAAFNQKGEAVWDGSSAQTWLNTDIDDGKHTTMEPKVLHRTREDYQVFKLTVFRKHIRQEVQTRKFWVYMADKKEKKKLRNRLRREANDARG
jgi:c-di-AMP phosphodiesterase-like protein